MISKYRNYIAVINLEPVILGTIATVLAWITIGTAVKRHFMFAVPDKLS